MTSLPVQRVYSIPTSSQHQSPIFSTLPGELRDMIFSYALSEYEDLTKRFDENTYFTRPGYRADKITDISLILTCQRIYNEAWYLPWMMREITIFMTSERRAPKKHVKSEELEQMLAKVNEIYGAKATQIPRIPHIRVFAQLYQLEDASILQNLLNINHFYPVCLTIGIRHTDWWYWETDEQLRISSSFVNNCRFPDTIKEIRMELETIERRIAQVHDVVKRMKESWAFTRLDGTKLTSRLNEEDQIELWEGSSILSEKRWIRDESKPGRLQYHIQTVRFRIERENRFGKGHVAQNINLPHDKYPKIQRTDLAIAVRDLTSRGLALDAPPDLVMDTMRRYRWPCWCSVHRYDPERGPNCCSKAISPKIGLGWRDEDLTPGNPFCSHCQLTKCEIKEGGRRARTRRTR